MIEIETARLLYADHDSAHGFDHVLRVWQMAQRIGEAEGADMLILKAATLLHDIGRAQQLASGGDHAAIGAARAAGVLDADYDQAQRKQIARVIEQHRFRGGPAPDSIEARVLYDADKLDAIGAIGVARAYAIAGVQGQRLWAEVSAAYCERPPEAGRDDLTDDAHTPVHEFMFKLIRLKDGLFTASGRAIAEQRHAFMLAYFEQLEAEVQGRR